MALLCILNVSNSYGSLSDDSQRCGPSRFHLLVILFQPAVRKTFPRRLARFRMLPKAPQDAWEGFGNSRFHPNGILFQADVPASPARCLARFRMLPQACRAAREGCGKPIIPSLRKFVPIGCYRKFAKRLGKVAD